MTAPVLVEGHVSLARLHGRACWHCGAVTRTLVPAGAVIRPGSPREWQVVSCGCRPATSLRPPASGTRSCTYCTQPGADCCVRVQPDAQGGRHILAHQVCAAVRGVSWWYVFTDAVPSRGATQ